MNIINVEYFRKKLQEVVFIFLPYVFLLLANYFIIYIVELAISLEHIYIHQWCLYKVNHISLTLLKKMRDLWQEILLSIQYLLTHNTYNSQIYDNIGISENS